MKKGMFLFVILLVVLVGCENKSGDQSEKKDTSSADMEDISVSFAGIEFSKAVNNAGEYCKIDSGQLQMNGVPKTNYFISPDGTRNEASAPILLTEIDNKQPFTFTTKLTNAIDSMYDAGTVYLYVNNSDWLKFAFERDEKGRNRVVTVRTKDSSDDNNHDILLQSSVYMKISSDTKQLGFYYSLDGTDWNLARLYRNDYPEKLWIGVSSQSPRGTGNIAYFENMSLTQTNVTSFRLGE